MRKIVNVRNSIYKAQKPRGIAASFVALSADISTSKAARQDGVAAISQEVELQNSTLAISF